MSLSMLTTGKGSGLINQSGFVLDNDSKTNPNMRMGLAILSGAWVAAGTGASDVVDSAGNTLWFEDVTFCMMKQQDTATLVALTVTAGTGANAGLYKLVCGTVVDAAVYELLIVGINPTINKTGQY